MWRTRKRWNRYASANKVAAKFTYICLSGELRLRKLVSRFENRVWEASCVILLHSFVGISSISLLANTHYNLGEPLLPSHPSTWEVEYSTGFNLSLWQRIKNFIRLWYHMYTVFNHFVPRQQALAEKYLGKVPDINEMEKNISIVFTSQREVIMHNKAQSLKIIPSGNLHMIKKSLPLSNVNVTFLSNGILDS